MPIGEETVVIELKTPGEVDAMRRAGRIVARVLATVRQKSAIGVSLKELDEVAADVLREENAGSSFLGYHPGFAPTPFPGVLCTSVNDAVVHGIPGGYRLRDGDLLSIDFGAHLGGWHGDAAITFVVGAAEPADLELIDTTARALTAGIDVIRPGATLGDIGHAISTIGRVAGYGLLAEHGGHGIGRAMHEAPHVPNDGRPGHGLRLREGMVLAIEPMFLAGGTDAYRPASDGWTLHTADGSRAAHVEHTVAVTADGASILTVP